MSRKKTGKVPFGPVTPSREDIYRGTCTCPLCGNEVSSYRLRLVLEGNLRFKDFKGACPICR